VEQKQSKVQLPCLLVASKASASKTPENKLKQVSPTLVMTHKYSHT
jgi:hypothetical protein